MTTAVSRSQLLASSCKPLEGSHGLAADVITEQLRVLSDWQLKSEAIERGFAFKNYYETMAFLNAVAYMVHHEDHHPDITFGYNQALLRFNTHSVNGISLNDFICAAKCDALYDVRPGAST